MVKRYNFNSEVQTISCPDINYHLMMLSLRQHPRYKTQKIYGFLQGRVWELTRIRNAKTQDSYMKKILDVNKKPTLNTLESAVVIKR